MLVVRFFEPLDTPKSRSRRKPSSNKLLRSLYVPERRQGTTFVPSNSVRLPDFSNIYLIYHTISIYLLLAQHAPALTSHTHTHTHTRTHMHTHYYLSEFALFFSLIISNTFLKMFRHSETCRNIDETGRGTQGNVTLLGKKTPTPGTRN